MKRILALVLALTMWVSLAFAAPLTEAAPLEGMACYPEGSDEATASYRFIYSYPQIVPESEGDNAINEFFDYQMNDALSFSAPLYAQDAEEGGASYTKISYQTTCNNDDYYCVLMTQEQFFGSAATDTWRAYAFARQGEEAGMVVNLADILSLSSPTNDDGLAYERSTQKANEMVYALVWEIIAQQIASEKHDYFEALSMDDLRAEFYPESDFYIDSDGNVVFFIQPAMIASSAAGMLTFPFSIDELVSEL